MGLRRLGTLVVLAHVALTCGAQDGPRASPTALFNKVVDGTTCMQFRAGGAVFRCEYQVGKLKFSIKDEGRGVYNIAFHHSDISEDLYAVMYDGARLSCPELAIR